jgi:CubicO group peptidase (beta-lactamase class C family)
MLDPKRRHVSSVLVLRHGELLVERYFRDRRADDLVDLHSVTKSFVSTLAGIAIAEGSLALTTTVGDLLADRIPELDSAKGEITVANLLTMTSGLAADGPHDIDEIADSGVPWIDGVLAAPLRSPPGTTFAYNNGTAHVLGVMLAAAGRTPLRTFAEERLFAPLGIVNYRWPTDPEANPTAYGHLELRPRDLVRFGELYLRRGRVGDRQLIDPEYVAEATTAKTPGGWPEGQSYGYFWWITRYGEKRAFFAGGFAGQYVTVVPELELVVVTTGDAAVFIPSSADALQLVPDVVIPALRP